jgi:hypothetical protein
VFRVDQTCPNGSVDGIQITTLGFMTIGEFNDNEFTPHICNITIASGETLYALVFKYEITFKTHLNHSI